MKGDDRKLNMKKKKVFWKSMSLSDSNKNLPLVLIAPSIIIIFGVLIYPIIYSIYMSLNNINFAQRSFEFAGLTNYAKMFFDANFINSVKLTIIFVTISVFFEIVLGTAIAVVLNKDFIGRGFVRGIMILPWALPSVVNAIMWKWIFNSNYGALNALLSQLGFIHNYQVWLGSSLRAFILMISANIWKETPYVVLLVLAGLATVSKNVYEAAKIDGASALRTFWSITLPLIKPVILILTVTKIIWSIQTFDLVYILTAGGPANGTELISYYIYKVTFKFLQFGYGSAMAYILTLITILLSYFYIRSLSQNSDVI